MALPSEVADFTTYMRYELNRSAHTVSAYSRDIMQFIHYMHDFSEDFNPAGVTTIDVRTWLRVLSASGDKPATIRRKTQALRSFFAFLKHRGKVQSNPCSDIVLAKIPSKLPEIVSSDDMELLLSETKPDVDKNYDDFRDHLILLLLYSTGMRQAELLGLCRKDFNINRRELRITGKRNKQRIVPLPEEVCKIMKQYLDMRAVQVGGNIPDSQILAKKNGKAMNKSALYSIVKVRLGTTSCRKKSPHVLRHSFATAMLNNGADINTVKEYLGHASLAATQIYTHLTLRELKTNYQHAHPRAKKED